MGCMMASTIEARGSGNQRQRIFFETTSISSRIR
jgi:hypothetical protein